LDVNKLMLALLLFPLSAFADAKPGAAQEFINTASAIAAPDWARASNHKAASGVDDVGLLVPSRQFFTASGELTEKGRTLLEKAEAFARQTNKKLNVLIPQAGLDEAPLPEIRLSSGHVQRNQHVGNHVYLSIKE
jgi:hypothetical protein